MLEPLATYKLIVLYMLDQVDFPLKKTQIFDFVLLKGYANYMPLQQAISELVDVKYVSSQSIRNSTHLSITEDGRSALQLLKGEINEGIRNDIKDYFKINEMSMRNDVSSLANYYRDANGEYTTELIVKERNSDILNIKITMPTEDASRSICENWQNKSQEVYEFLVSKLMS